MTMKPFCVRCGGTRVFEFSPDVGTCQECGLVMKPLSDSMKTMEEYAAPLLEMASIVLPTELGNWSDVVGNIWTLDEQGWFAKDIRLDPSHNFMLVPQAPFTKVVAPDDISGLVDL